MDDVDAAEALQAKTMLLSGDWVTQRLNGVVYLDKAPLKYWLTAALFRVFGIHDWVARLPTAIATILLCLLVYRIGEWFDGPKTGFYAGLVLSTSIGLFLFTRTIIPDVILTLFITLSLWCFIRALESEQLSRRWALSMYVFLACAVLTKGLIGLVLPTGIGVIYLFIARKDWRRLHILPGVLLFLVIAAPWHVLATIRNPPVFDFTLHAGDHFGGKFRGFFWFYFINEQLLRFLNERWPRDYNTVPRFWFWAYHLLWFFPWSLYFPAALKQLTRMRLLMLCWIGFVMLFFTLSTTQEYYSMPIYPAIALLLGSAMANREPGTKIAGAICATAAVIVAVLLGKVWNLPTPGDIFSALIQHPSLYTLSLGHMADLTIPALAYLRTPLLVAGLALAVGGLGALLWTGWRAYLSLAMMLVIFFQAARLALVVFDPYLSSYAIAEKLKQLPPGVLVVSGKFNPLSSLSFYSDKPVLQNGDDLDILEYGALAPGAPKIQISDAELKQLPAYIVTKKPQTRFLFRTADKYLVSNIMSP